MVINFCTLFDSGYLDKGLTMYNSLMDTGCEFVLYILAMDDRCYEILNDLDRDNIVAISLEEFMNGDLRRIREERSRAEFCWTCSSYLISYILNKYRMMDMCTYIDADLYFYSDPKVLIDEFSASGKSVSIIEHRFDNSRYSAELKKNSGKYCVEFNSFRNDEKAHKVLNDWKEKCLKSCTSDADGESFGDQKYQDTWPVEYDCIYETTHLGAGLAPWNISQYRYVDENVVKMGRNSGNIDLIFYHYHMIHYISEKQVDINVFTRSGHAQEKLVYGLYKDYLARIEEMRNMLSDVYGMDYSVKKKDESAHNGHKAGKLQKIKEYLSRDFFSKVYMKIHYILNKKKDYLEV